MILIHSAIPKYKVNCGLITDKYQNDFETLTNQIENLQFELDQARQSTNESDLEILKQELDAKDHTLGNLQSHIQTLTTQSEHLEMQSQKNLNEMSQIREQLNSERDIFSQTESNFVKLQVKYDQETQHLQSVNQSVGYQMQDQIHDNNILKQNILEADKRIVHLESIITDKNDNLKKLAESHELKKYDFEMKIEEQSKTSLASQDAIISEFSEKIQVIQSEKHSTEIAMQSLQKSLANTVEVCKQKEQTVQQLNVNINSMQQIISEYSKTPLLFATADSSAQAHDLESRQSNEESFKKYAEKVATLENDISQLAKIIKKKDLAINDNACEAERYIIELENAIREQNDGHWISTKEYASLSSRAEKLDQSTAQIENLLSVLEESSKEIVNLKETIKRLAGETSLMKPSDNISKRLQRQVEELRKVWASELGANTKLRSIFSKTQADMLLNQQENQKKNGVLHEEIDEISLLYQKSAREIMSLKSEKEQHDADARAKELIYEERLDVEIRSHQKEKNRFDFQISQTEKARDKLQSEIAKVKATYEDALSNSLSEIEDLISKDNNSTILIKTLENKILELNSELKKLRSLHSLDSQRIQDFELKISEVTIELRQAQSKYKTQHERALELEVEKEQQVDNSTTKQKQKHEILALSRQLQQNELDLQQTKSEHLSELERLKKHEKTIRLKFESESNRLQNDFDIQITRLTNSNNFKDKKILNLEQEFLDERQHLQDQMDYEIRDSLQQEQTRAQKKLESKLNELRYNYEHALDESVEHRSKLEQLLDDAEKCIANERDHAYNHSIKVHEREKMMMEEIKVLEMKLSRHLQSGIQTPFERPDRWTFEKREMQKEIAHMQMEIEKEKYDFERQTRDLVAELRVAERNLTNHQEMWSKEKKQMLSDISGLKSEIMTYQTKGTSIDSTAMIGLLVDEKKRLESTLSLNESQTHTLQHKLTLASSELELLKAKDYESQSKRFENLLSERERQLIDADARINELEHQYNKRELEYENHVQDLDKVVNEREGHLIEADGRIRDLDDQLIRAETRINEFEHQIFTLTAEQNEPVRDLDPDVIERIKEQAEVQIRFERDRAKRLAYKIEELKERNKKLKQQIASQNTGSVRVDQISNFEGDAIAEMFDQIFGDDEIAEGFKAQCETIVREVFHLRGLVNRLMLWRADLRYQKLYLSLKVQDLLSRY